MPDFGPLVPDLPPFGHEGLVTAQNVIPNSSGVYEPVRSPSEFTAALAETWMGGGYFEGTGGNTALLAGTSVNLYSYSGGAWTGELAASSYTQPWFFSQFGNLVICTNGGAPQKYDLSTGTASALGGTPPSASYSAIVKDFVFASGNSSNTNRVYWSAINNAEGWTVGTDQSDYQDLPDGGPVTGLAGGDYGLAFQANAITVFEYVGGATIFNVRKVSQEIGAMCHGSIAQAGKRCFFYHRRGFYMFLDGETVPIGRGKIDKTFRNLYSVDEIQNNIRASVDPERNVVFFSMPDRLWVYNWESERWGVIYYPGIVGIGLGATSSVTLEDIAVLFPSIEDVTPSLDDPYWQGGSPLILAVLNDNKLHSFSGTMMEATFGLPRIELYPGREAHIRNARMLSDVTSGVILNVSTSLRLGDSQDTTQTTTMQANGDLPIRATGHFVQPTFTVQAGSDWSYAQGYDFAASPGGTL